MRFFKSERRGWIFVGIVLLIGLLCVFMTSTWALRFSPSWRLAADMRSQLDPDSNYLTHRPRGEIQPVDPSILTQPVWINFFLTPGTATSTQIPVVDTRVPLPTSTPRLPTDAPARTPTATLAELLPTTTSTHIPTLQMSTATKILPATATTTRISTSTRTPTKIAASPTTVAPKPTKTPTRTVTAIASPTPTRTATRTATVTATSTATVTPTPTATFAATSTPSSTVTTTNPLPPEADLQITITDHATDYEGDISVQYTIVVSNPAGPAAVTTAPVISVFSENLTNITWTCTASGSASCASNGIGNISDAVDLSVGASVTYTVNATVVSSPAGDLISTASIGVPSGITDVDPGNNTAIDIDYLVITYSFR